MTLLPPNRVTNSAGEATVKSLCRSMRLRSLPCFTRWSPDMLGLEKHTQYHHNSQCSLRNTEYKQMNTVEIHTLGTDSIADRFGLDFFEFWEKWENKSASKKFGNKLILRNICLFVPLHVMCGAPYTNVNLLEKWQNSKNIKKNDEQCTFLL